MTRLPAIALAILSATPACAQPYYAPPQPYDVPPVYAAPDPLAAFFGGLLGIPGAIIGGLVGGPVPVVPDGQGGYVPITNSRVMPDGSLRPYDPAIDGPFYVQPPQDYYPPPAPRLPRHRAQSSAPHTSGRCYDGSGVFIEPPSPECEPPPLQPGATR
jgi:hypothetical protein